MADDDRFSQNPALQPASGRRTSSPRQEVRKSNTEIGYKVQSGNLSLLSRKLINILLYYAQRMHGQEDDEGKFWIDAPRLIKDARFNSRNYDLLREALDELQSVRIIRPTATGGITSDVLLPSFTLTNVIHSDNDDLITGQKKRGGLLMVGFSFPAHIKDLLLDPRSNYTVLPIIYVASLRTIGGLVLYEIAKRYATNPSGVTNRETWQWWWHILTGAPPEVEPPEYKYFKRDVLKRAIEEINAVTDMRVQVIEHRVGRFVRELQFAVDMARQSSIEIEPPPMDTALLARLTALGISTAEAERLVQRYNETDLVTNIALVEARIANQSLPPIASPAAYLKSAIKGEYGAGKQSQVQAQRAQHQQNQEAAATEQASAAQAEAAKQAEADATKAAAKAWHDGLSHAEQDELLNTFSATLVEPLAGQFRKSGFKSRLLSQAWLAWLSQQHRATFVTAA